MLFKTIAPVRTKELMFTAGPFGGRNAGVGTHIPRRRDESLLAEATAAPSAIVGTASGRGQSKF